MCNLLFCKKRQIFLLAWKCQKHGMFVAYLLSQLHYEMSLKGSSVYSIKVRGGYILFTYSAWPWMIINVSMCCASGTEDVGLERVLALQILMDLSVTYLQCPICHIRYLICHILYLICDIRYLSRNIRYLNRHIMMSNPSHAISNLSHAISDISYGLSNLWHMISHLSHAISNTGHIQCLIRRCVYVQET